MTSRLDGANSTHRRLTLAVAVFALAALAVMPGPAAAQSTDSGEPTKPAGGGKIGRRYELVTGPDIARLLRKMGYPAKLYRDKKGDPKIRSRLDGTRFYVGFYGCTKVALPRCRSIQLYSGYKKLHTVSYVTLNMWNAKRRYARAYRQPANSKIVFLELDMPFQGVSDMTFRKQFDMFRRLNALFRKHIGFNN